MDAFYEQRHVPTDYELTGYGTLGPGKYRARMRNLNLRCAEGRIYRQAEQVHGLHLTVRAAIVGSHLLQRRVSGRREDRMPLEYPSIGKVLVALLAEIARWGALLNLVRPAPARVVSKAEGWMQRAVGVATVVVGLQETE